MLATLFDTQESYCLFGVNLSFKLGRKIKASKPPRIDLKMVRVIEMTFLHTAWHSRLLLRPKNKVKLSTQSAEIWIFMGK